MSSTSFYIRISAYEFLHTNFYIRVSTYEFLHTNFYIRISTYEFLHTKKKSPKKRKKAKFAFSYVERGTFF